MESLPVQLVSPSRIKTWFECPKKHWFTYVLELAPKKRVSKRHFDKGNYFHELAHVYYQQIQAGAQPATDYILASMTNRIQKDAEAYLKENTADPKLLGVYAIITRMMVRYIKEQSPKIDQRIQVLGVEDEVSLDCGDFVLSGFADLLYVDRSGRLCVRDNKTGEKAWTTLDVQFSNQLLFYSAVLWKMTGEVPVAEINYINTKEYKTQSKRDDSFNFTRIIYTERELRIYFDDICRIVDKMLHSEPDPHYDQHCRYCAFQAPCYASRIGADPIPLLESNYEHRESRHRKFTEEHTSDDNSD